MCGDLNCDISSWTENKNLTNRQDAIKNLYETNLYLKETDINFFLHPTSQEVYTIDYIFKSNFDPGIHKTERLGQYQSEMNNKIKETVTKESINII